MQNDREIGRFFGLPAGSRTRNCALGGRRYIHLTTERYIKFYRI